MDSDDKHTLQALAQEKVVQSRKDTPALTSEQIAELITRLPDWTVQKEDPTSGTAEQLTKVFHFNNYGLTMAFANSIAELAEMQNHHPALLVEWGKVKVTWWTHTINGLAMNDFILAARTELLYDELHTG